MKKKNLFMSVATVILLLSTTYTNTNAFQLPINTRGRYSIISPAPIQHKNNIVSTNKNKVSSSFSSSQLQLTLVPSIVTKTVSKISPQVRTALLLTTAAFFLYKNKPKNFPAPSDSSFSEPLPDGSLGCPYFGNLSFFTKIGEKSTGAGYFYRFQAYRSGSPNMFKYAPLGSPAIIVNGISNVKKVFNKEFKLVKTGVISDGFTDLMGGESLLFTTDPVKHQYLRRLVGQSMTPDQISKAMPSLIKSANDQIDTLKVGEHFEMEKILTSFTLDVAWRQILGLDLNEVEVPTFYNAVEDWIGGILNPVLSLMPSAMKVRTKCGRAMKYLISKVEDKLQKLEANGQDGSTLSGMYFAKDEEDPTKVLTKQNIISNTFLLILAGTETAASTLTVAMLVLGLHKDILQKLKDEQLAMMAKHDGKEMTRDMLEEDCPYLDAFIKEVMRIKPLATTGAMRFAQETFVVDGKQIPKDYGVGFNAYLTHQLDPAIKEDDNSHMDVVKGFKPERWLSEDTKPTEYSKSSFVFT